MGIRTPEPVVEMEESILDGRVQVDSNGKMRDERGVADDGMEVVQDKRARLSPNLIQAADNVYIQQAVQDSIQGGQENVKDVNGEFGEDKSCPKLCPSIKIKTAATAAVQVELSNLNSPALNFNTIAASQAGLSNLTFSPSYQGKVCDLSQPGDRMCKPGDEARLGSPHPSPPSLELAIGDNEMQMCLECPSPGELPPRLELALEGADSVARELAKSPGHLALVPMESVIPDAMLGRGNSSERESSDSRAVGGNSCPGDLVSASKTVVGAGRVEQGVMATGLDSSELLHCHVALERVDDCSLVQKE